MSAPDWTQIKFLDRTQPEFSVEEAAAAADRLYGIRGEITPLLSERDLNFRIQTDAGAGYVLKISNAAESPGVLDFQVKALRHIETVAPELPVPRVVPAAGGEPVGSVLSSAGTAHLTHMLTYLPGETLSGQPRPPALWEDLGGHLGRLDRSLRSFFHPYASHELLWDIQRSPDLLPLSRCIADKGARGNVEIILANMRDEVIPMLARLRHQVIHADVHADNTLSLPGKPLEVSGIVDFGDMIFAPLVAEIAIAADLDTVPSEDILDCLAALVSGFDLIYPLEEEEPGFLYPLILARFAATAAILAWRREVTPNQPPYITLEEEPLWAFMDRFQTIGARRVTRVVSQAIGYPLDEETGSTESLLDRRRARLGRGSPIFYNRPVHIIKGSGPWLLGPGGRAYLDAYNNVPVAGHSHPHVVRSIARQMGVLNTNSRYLYRAILDYSERLVATLQPPLTMCLFVNSGSEANDLAWQIARFATGCAGGLVVEGAYHGITEAVRDLSPATEERPLAPHIRTLENPDPYRGRYRYGENGLADKYAADADRAIQSLTGSGHGLAAFMVDSAFVSSGIPDVPEGYLVRVAHRVRAAGGLVIADEVQSGFGRLGEHLWGFAVHGMRPDIVTLGKPIGNGYPLGAVVTSPEILEPFLADTGLFSTFGGNSVACAAGMAVLDVIEKEGLVRNAYETGVYLRKGLRNLAAKHPLIGDVRGRGLLAGVELVKDRNSREPAAAETRQVVERMRLEGVLVGSEGLHGNVLKIRPPLVFRRQHADRLVAALDVSLTGF